MSRQEKTERTDRVLKKKRGNSAALCSAAGTIILVLVILACLPLTLPRLAGYSLYSVISGSMEPEIPVGSLVLIHDADPVYVEEGDVIAFYGAADSSAVITHRVVSNSPVVGEIITKGDANAERDMNPVDYENFIGKVEHVVPRRQEGGRRNACSRRCISGRGLSSGAQREKEADTDKRRGPAVKRPLFQTVDDVLFYSDDSILTLREIRRGNCRSYRES